MEFLTCLFNSRLCFGLLFDPIKIAASRLEPGDNLKVASHAKLHECLKIEKDRDIEWREN